MKVTILTPSYNQAQFIEQNILSVYDQHDVDVEHIVIDGGSTDGTVEILKKYPHLKWLSEKDAGQADALQKGLSMATGDIIGWINSDDYLEKDVLGIVSGIFESSLIDWVIGNLTFTFEKGKVLPDRSRIITRRSLLSNPDFLRQQGAFFRRDALVRCGGFDKKYHLCMDLDLWFRMLRLSEPLMFDQNLAYFRIHEAQKTSGKQNEAQLKEMLDIFSKNNAGNYYKMKIRIRKILFGIRLWLVKTIKKSFTKKISEET